MTLIKRLEAATGPDRKLDDEIALVTGWGFDPEFLTLQWTSPDGQISKSLPPNFTGSIDAARSIFPNAMLIYANEIGADGLPYVQLCTNTSTNPVTVHAGIGATLEIAWCVSRAESKGLFQ